MQEENQVFLGNLFLKEGSVYRVGLQHFYPIGCEVDTSEGILVDKPLPEPEEQEGKIPEMYVNKDTKEITFDYVDKPLSETEKLQKQLDEQNKLVANLTFEVMNLEGGK